MPLVKAESGIEWNYDICGEGDVLLFIHGWGVDGRIWRQQIKHFSQQYKVMTLDLPGHGKSGWEKVSLETIANDLNGIISDLMIEQLTIVGSSLGGLTALKLFNLSPNLIERMIFVGSLPKFSKTEDYPYGLDIKEMRKLESQLKRSYPFMVHVFFRSLFTIEERKTRRFKWLMKFKQEDTVPMKQALLDYLDILEHEDLREILRDVKIPIQFINGREDHICDQASVAHIKLIQPQARYDFFEKCGHFTFLSMPHEFNQVMESFLEETKCRV